MLFKGDGVRTTRGMTRLVKSSSPFLGSLATCLWAPTLSSHLYLSSALRTESPIKETKRKRDRKKGYSSFHEKERKPP